MLNFVQQRRQLRSLIKAIANRNYVVFCVVICATTVTLGALAQPLASASTVRCTMARRILTAVGLVTGLALLL